MRGGPHGLRLDAVAVLSYPHGRGGQRSRKYRVHPWSQEPSLFEIHQHGSGVCFNKICALIGFLGSKPFSVQIKKCEEGQGCPSQIPPSLP